jgi:hypothetical protein
VKLPDVEYGAAVQGSGDSFARVDRAQREALGTIAEGFNAFGREVVRTQGQKASASLQAGLAELEAEIERTPYLTTQQVRDQLGGNLDALDEATRQSLVRRALDMQTGEAVEVDRDDVPMWKVAAAIYEKRAKDLMKTASSAMTVGEGWRAEFEARAGEDVAARKTRLGQSQFRAMLQDQRKEQAEALENFVRAGNWQAAQELIATSRAYEPAEKEDLAGKVELEQQRRPLEERRLAGIKSVGDALEAGKLIQRLESGEGLEQMDQGERADWKRRLEAEVKDFEQDQATAGDRAQRAADEEARNTILGAYIQANGRQLPRDLIPQPGTVSSGTLQWAINLVESTKPGAREIKTDMAAYAELNRIAMTDPAKFKTLDLGPYFGRLAVPDARHYVDLQRTLRVDGPDGVKYTSFYGPQEETNTRLIAHGFHVSGSDAEKDAVAVGYVQREVNRALFNAAKAKAARGDAAPLTPAEQTFLVAPLVDKLVAAKAWKAEASSSGIPAEYQGPVRDSTLRRGKGIDPKAQEKTMTELGAWRGDIEAGWRAGAGTRVLLPADEVAVFDIIQTQGKQIEAALQKAGKASGSSAVAAIAVRAYLGGAR